MTDFSNWKIKIEDYDEHAEEYTEVANWCNSTQQYTIIDDGEYYKVVPIIRPETPAEVENA